MNKKIVVLALMTSLFLASTPARSQVVGDQVNSCNLTVRIDNIREVKGEMQLGLYNKAENFPKVDKQYKLVIRKVTGKIFQYTFRGLPPGEYALAVFQDRNSDGKINKNILGIPKEPYGFSNNIKPHLSAPSFEKTKFLLDSDKTVSITLFD